MVTTAVCINLLSSILRHVTVAAKKESFNCSEYYPGIFDVRAEERLADKTSVLSRRGESRKRNLSFHLPAAVPLAPHIRIVQDDSSYISLQGIYEDYCARTGQHKDDPLRLATEKIQQAPEVQNNVMLHGDSEKHKIDRLQKQALIDLKVDILGIIQNNLVPETIVLNVSDLITCMDPRSCQLTTLVLQAKLQVVCRILAIP